MAVPKNILKFLNENNSAPKDEIIKNMMTIFSIKESTAITYYSNKSFYKKNARKIVFDYLKKNPKAIDDGETKKHAKNIGVCDITFKKYRSLYEVRESDIEINVGEGRKRKREKFLFDDSRL